MFTIDLKTPAAAAAHLVQLQKQHQELQDNQLAFVEQGLEDYFKTVDAMYAEAIAQTEQLLASLDPAYEPARKTDAVAAR